MIWVRNARHIKDFQVEVSFNEGTTFRIDLKNELTGEIFRPLRDAKEFSKFKVHPELETLVWENGADFSPEYLYELGKTQNRQRA
ncbi:MAG TPA: DUF2442 domain-containing protein [Bdellovibrionota bacterium]|nr:DUF2442 domain-containing protein [Bdellovibrionota bacterium]